MVTLTFGATQIGSGIAGQGINLYVGTSSGNSKNYVGLGAPSNHLPNSIIVKTDIIQAVSINPQWRSASESYSDAATFQNNVKPILTPEPATATLSLLAPVGLCARSHRK